MKKMLFAFALVIFLMAGNASAFQMYISNTNSYDHGEIITHFTDPQMDAEWTYCVQKDEHINWNTNYDYTLVDVADYPSSAQSDKGYSAAWLIYNAYGANPSMVGGSISRTAQKGLQNSIWDVFINGTSYAAAYAGSEIMLSTMFDIVVTSGTDIQNLIVYNPETPGAVPIPGAGLLFCAGIVGLVGLKRKNA